MFLPNPSQSVSRKRFHQCVNHEACFTNFGSFRIFQSSLWLGVNKVLQKVTKLYKSELRNLLQYCILIPNVCIKPHLHTQWAGPRGGRGLKTPPAPFLTVALLDSQTHHSWECLHIWERYRVIVFILSHESNLTNDSSLGKNKSQRGKFPKSFMSICYHWWRISTYAQQDR